MTAACCVIAGVIPIWTVIAAPELERLGAMALAKPEPGLRGHLTEQEAVAAYEDSGAKRLLIVHRPSELPLDESLTQAWDGYETEV